MTTIDMVLTHIGRQMQAKAERRAVRRVSIGAWQRVVKALLQIAGLGWLDWAAWDWSRTAGYVAVGISFMLVSAMITTNGEGGRAERR